MTLSDKGLPRVTYPIHPRRLSLSQRSHPSARRSGRGRRDSVLPRDDRSHVRLAVPLNRARWK